MDHDEKSFHDVAYSHASRLAGDGHFALELDGFPLKGVRRVEVIDNVGEPMTLVVELVVGSVNKPEPVNAETAAFARQVDEPFESFYKRVLTPRLERLEALMTRPK